MPEPTPSPEQSVQHDTTAPTPSTPPSAATTGRRLPFQDIKRQLTPEELANPGTQKLILDMLLTTEAERDDLKAYIPKYHEADKKVGVLEEKLKTSKVNEVMFAVGIGVGCAIMGLGPFFWEAKNIYGIVALAVGFLLTVGAAIGRIVFK